MNDERNDITAGPEAGMAPPPAPPTDWMAVMIAGGAAGLFGISLYLILL